MVIATVGITIGAIINIILFIKYDDNWSLEIIQLLMTIGLILTAITGFICLLFHDK